MSLADVSREGRGSEEASARLGMYRLLRRLYERAPDEELLERLDVIGLLGAGDGGDRPDARSIAAYAEEHTRIFVGPGPHVSPHESVHSREHGALNGPETVAVRKFILASGFDFRTEFQGLTDHICVEFEYMEALVERQLACIESSRDDELANSLMLQREFMSRHVIGWVPNFCDKVKAFTVDPLYRALADATAVFLHAEAAMLRARAH